MRRLVVALLGLLLGLGVIAAIVAANLDTYLARNRDWLAERAQAALGRPVRFERLSVSFRGGLGVRVDDLRIGDDPAFATDDFLRVGSAHVVVAVLPALTGRYQLKRVVLEAPSITIVRDARGVNVATLGGGRGEEERAGERRPPRDVALDALEIRDGTVRFGDRIASRRATSPSAPST